MQAYDGGWASCWVADDIVAELETAQAEGSPAVVGLFSEYSKHLDTCPVCKGHTSQYAELFRKCSNPPVGIGHNVVRAE